MKLDIDRGSFLVLRRLIITLTLLLVVSTPPTQSARRQITLSPQTPQQELACDNMLLGSQLLREKQPFKARVPLEKAVQLWPQNCHTHYYLGICYTDIGEFEKSMREFQTCLQIDPSQTKCISAIASCFQLMGRPNDAIAWFEGYLQRNPKADDAEGIHNMIAALKRQASIQVDSDPRNPDYLASITNEGRRRRWAASKLPLKVFISNGRDTDGSIARGFRPSFNQVLIDSLDAWIKASEYRLSYEVVTDVKKADIVCTWTHRVDFLKQEATKMEQGVAEVVSQRTSPTEDLIKSAHVTLLVINPSTGKSLTDEEMKKACLHEFGHALGFRGHSTNNRDVMFFSDSPSIWAALTKRDKATMCRLYEDYPPQRATQAAHFEGRSAQILGKNSEATMTPGY